MRALLPFVLVALVGFAVFVLVASPRLLQKVTPTGEIQGWDRSRHAFRQLGARSASAGRESSQRITILGPSTEILEPWLVVRFHTRGFLLISGPRTTEPFGEEAATVWRGNDGVWHSSALALDNLEGLSAELRDRDLDLLEELRRRNPERGELFERIAETGGPFGEGAKR